MNKGIKWIIAFIGAAIFVLLLRCFAFTSFIIPSKGMEGSLLQGDRILVNKWSYGFRVPLLSHLSYRRWKENPVKTGDIVVFNNPANLSEVIDDKEIFISRCFGLPGDTLIVDSVFTQVSPDIEPLLEREYYFAYPIEKEEELDTLLMPYNIVTEVVLDIDSINQVRKLPWPVYHDLELSMGKGCWLKPIDKQAPTNIHPLIIPSVGTTVAIYPWNRTLMMNTILLHEGKDAKVQNDTLYVDNQPVNEYTFTKDYYWMVSNNSFNAADSRLFGFLPHDHIIGKASYIWFSKEPNTSLFDGYRWNRFFEKIQ